MKYSFIQKHAQLFGINLLCDVLGVSRSGYYDWLSRPMSPREQANQQLDEKIKVIYMRNKQRYGSPRITRALQAESISCSHTRIERRMRSMGLKALAKRRFKITTDSGHNKPIFENILKRDFTTTAINQKWVSDLTYIPTREGWLYLAVVIDVHSRSVIGSSMNKSMKQDLVCDALLMALFKRKYPKQVIIHSDRGSQYCSKKYREIIKQNKLIGSMSRKTNCWDNAIAESFFHTLKTELVHVNDYTTRAEARQSLFQYIEGYYNHRRMHSAIDYKTPVALECAA
ncbi:IS3 family transposase [Candidiatus Paracoxiella cheracis]|uniref:IS3 family transposase n=1 Tax=Candidiatus Paracoxiella cheracis TaxID=3405120 RepID=UPI003BF46149